MKNALYFLIFFTLSCSNLPSVNKDSIFSNEQLESIYAKIINNSITCNTQFEGTSLQDLSLKCKKQQIFITEPTNNLDSFLISYYNSVKNKKVINKIQNFSSQIITNINAPIKITIGKFNPKQFKLKILNEKYLAFFVMADIYKTADSFLTYTVIYRKDLEFNIVYSDERYYEFKLLKGKVVFQNVLSPNGYNSFVKQNTFNELSIDCTN